MSFARKPIRPPPVCLACGARAGKGTLEACRLKGVRAPCVKCSLQGSAKGARRAGFQLGERNRIELWYT